MTEPFNGLRFDIYERVNLPEQAAAIGELEEIELVPNMRALNQEDHVLLKGHLLLSGVYRAADDRGGMSRLEHRIPVEISLPQNRVSRLEDLTVEIDNFDVDVLSARSLNVTGVLALRGLQAESQPAPVWRDDSFTVVHQAGEEPADASELREAELSFGGSEEPAETSQAQPFVDEENADLDGSRDFAYSEPPSPGGAWNFEGVSSPADSDTGNSAVPAPLEWKSEVGWGDIPVRADSSGTGIPDSISDSEESPADDRQELSVEEMTDVAEDPIFGGTIDSDPQPAAESVEPAAAEPAPEKPAEMKVALGGKPLDSSERVPSGVGLLSMLGDKGAAKEALQKAMRSALEEEEQERREADRSSTGDELEWTKLFLSKGSESQEFSKVKMCIVQKEETLDSIAARYNVQTRELQLRNRLSDIYVSEGQVLYIP
ncbi:LysM peptidoglycan-binding domain-containing protein [Cohnella caldifontis]|uniref:LysM peptidoglycan-binding domain-containing protein n=1 Tax=Cohnella caldifontis TaxID=3027471 RepID=UPI0023ED2355|nr:LysM peptidoglycan-binding domain-containing protein [Cohnella sp. YIM B05605]